MNCIQYWSFVLLLRIHLEYADYGKLRILLESFIEAEIPTHEICSVPGDGLCILSAFKVYWIGIRRTKCNGRLKRSLLRWT